MKASIRFREDQKPLVRAKIPISILGLPFLSGVSAGEYRELRLDLATAFDSGPCFRVSYRPNDTWNPFSLVVKTGIGTFGAPFGAPMAMTAEFNLLGAAASAGGPTFSILFKPRLGDFCIKKTTGSAVIAPVVGRKRAVDADRDGEGSVNGVETPVFGFRPENGSHLGKKVNRFPMDFTAAGGGGIQGLLSGVEITARSVLPLRSRAAVRFRWGVRMPPELRAAFAEDAGGGMVPAAGISLRKLPLLVMNKISIEHVALDDRRAKEQKAVAGGDVVEACLSVRRQLEALHAENGLLRKAVEELRAEVGGGQAAPSAGGQVSGGGDVGKGGNKAAAGGKRDRWTDGKSQESSGKAAAEEVNEELKKALMGAGKI